MMTNLFGLAGVAAVAAAVGGLTGNWWWSMFVAGVAVVILSAIAQYNSMTTADEDDGALPAQSVAPVKPLPSRARSA